MIRDRENPKPYVAAWLEQRKGKYHILCWKEPASGKRRTRSLGPVTKRAANTELRRLRNQLERHAAEIVAGARMVIDRLQAREAVKLFRAEYQEGREGQRVADVCDRMLGRFVEWCEKELSGELYSLRADPVSDHLGAYRRWLTEKERGTKRKALSHETQKKHLDALKMFLVWAVDNDFVDLKVGIIKRRLRMSHAPSNPKPLMPSVLRQVVSGIARRDSERCHSSRENKNAYWSGEADPSAPHRYEPWHPFIFLAILTGASSDTIRTMTWGQVQFELGRVVAWRGKNKKEYYIPLRDSPALIRLLKGLQKNEYGGKLFVAGDAPIVEKAPRAWESKEHARIMKLIGCEGVTPKGYRTSFGTLVAAGIGAPSVRDLAHRMAHTLQTADTYYHKQVEPRPGSNIEGWLGVSEEIHAAMDLLGYEKLSENSRV